MAVVRGREPIGSRLFDAGNYALLLLLSVTFVYPFWTIVLQAFSPPEDLYRLGMHVWISDWRLEPWYYVFQEERVGLAYFNTVSRTVVGTLATLLVTFTGAYALSKRNLPFRASITAVYLMTLFFSGGLIPFYLLVRGLGLINTRMVLILPLAINVFNIIIARNFLMTIDQAMEDSAVIDGAGYWRVLFRIMVPLSRPVIAVIALWTAVSYWNEWFQAMIFAPKKHLQVLQMLAFHQGPRSSLPATARTGISAGSIRPVGRTSPRPPHACSSWTSRSAAAVAPASAPSGSVLALA